MSRQIGVTLAVRNSIPRLLEGRKGRTGEKNAGLKPKRGTTVVFAQFTVA